jgi:anthranilate synthase component 1
MTTSILIFLLLMLISTEPRKVLEIGPGFTHTGDPLRVLQSQLGTERILDTEAPGIPPFIGGAVGYLSYDAIKYFEPKTERPLKDDLQIPEALFMLYDTIVVFDHFRSTLNIITLMRLPQTDENIQPAYDKACAVLRSTLDEILHSEIPVPDPHPKNELPQNRTEHDYSSNIGRQGYETFVKRLKEKIVMGEIIQAVPSQRMLVVMNKSQLRPPLPKFANYRKVSKD